MTAARGLGVTLRIIDGASIGGPSRTVARDSSELLNTGASSGRIIAVVAAAGITVANPSAIVFLFNDRHANALSLLLLRCLTNLAGTVASGHSSLRDSDSTSSVDL